jgi:hypothetical protein
MLIVKDSSGVRYQVVGAVAPARPYNSGLVKVCPVGQEVTPDNCYVRDSMFLKVVSQASMNGDNCRRHDMDVLMRVMCGL